MTAAVTIAPEPFDARDSQALRAALLAELVERYGADTELGVKPSAADTAVFLVARRAGEPVGCGALRALDPTTVEVKRMFVAPAARGSGTGRLLLEALQTQAVALGATRIVLESGTEQRESLALYESAGYRPIPCFGAYAGAPQSRCYERALWPG